MTPSRKPSRASKKSPLYGDEGMWVLNNIPFQRIKERYDAQLPADFGQDVMRAAVRINSGGSASFVSKDGLLITNHHVAHSHIASLSTADNDLVKNGYLAKSRAEELKLPQAEVNVLREIVDVTKRVLGKKGPARKAEIAKIEEESKKKTGMRSDVVELYQGGAYHLYLYERYTDVRLVFAPEMAIASFGGDFDNYEFPRYDLDIAMLRVYKDGKPVTPKKYLKFADRAPIEGELLFVTGHPGRTDRLSTYDALIDIRDNSLPYRLRSMRRQEVSFDQYAGRGPEYARRAGREIATIKNLRKRYVGQLEALQDPAFMQRAKREEDALKKLAQGAAPWKKVTSALKAYDKYFLEYDIWESMIGFGGHYDKPTPTRSNWSTYLAIARCMLRMQEEDRKPSGKRLPEYADARRQSLLDVLYSPAPIYNDLEVWKLTDAFRLLLETYGPEDRSVKEILAGKAPEVRAAELIAGTKLEDPENRKRVSQKDTMIWLAKVIDKRARAARKLVEEKVKSPFDEAYRAIAQAQFKAYGNDHYPDATFTLRLAYGTPKSLVKNGETYPHYTTIADTLKHQDAHEGVAPWVLPPSWIKAREWVKGSRAPFNFMTTHDSHGGNSGSPVLTKDFEFVGILFDGISSGQGSTFRYGDYERTVCVSAAGILAILKNIYKADHLVKELL
ncbi:MAG: S46 family peptidase [Patescibacteria group bacterium]